MAGRRRILLAAGTSTAFPAALVLIRAAMPDPPAAQPAAVSASEDPPDLPPAGGTPVGRPAGGTPAGALAVLTIAGSTSAALGPVLGGFLVAFLGWQAVFLVNVPITLAGVALALRLLPRVPSETGRPAGFLRTLDIPGIAAFSATLTGLLIFVLSLAGRPQWWLAPVVAVLGVLLVLRERAAATPFLDVRGLVANRSLSAVLGQQAGFNLVFYCVFFGLPLWLGSVRGFGADTVGLLVLPIAAMGVLMTPVAARTVRLRGSRWTLALGSAVLLLATLLVQVLTDSTPVAVLVGVALLFGIPGGFNNLGLQSALYEASPPDRMGSSGGLFQTFRYLGAISATSVLGLLFEHDLSSRGLHRVGLIMTCVSVVLLGLALLRHTSHRAATAPADA